MDAHGRAVTRPRAVLAPLARADLEAHERDEAAELILIVKDPALGQYHRLGPTAFSLLELLEEEQLADDLPALMSEHYGLSLGPSDVERMIAEFDRLQLFTVTPARAAERGE